MAVTTAAVVVTSAIKSAATTAAGAPCVTSAIKSAATTAAGAPCMGPDPDDIDRLGDPVGKAADEGADPSIKAP